MSTETTESPGLKDRGESFSPCLHKKRDFSRAVVRYTIPYAKPSRCSHSEAPTQGSQGNSSATAPRRRRTRETRAQWAPPRRQDLRRRPQANCRGSEGSLEEIPLGKEVTTILTGFRSAP